MVLGHAVQASFIRGAYNVWNVPCPAGFAAAQPPPEPTGTAPLPVPSQLVAPAVWPMPVLAALSWPLPGEGGTNQDSSESCGQ